MSGDIWKMLSEIPQEEHEEGSGVAPVAKQWQPLKRIITDAAGSAGVGDGRNMRGAVEPLKKKTSVLTIRLDRDGKYYLAARCRERINHQNFKEAIKGKQSEESGAAAKANETR